MVVGRWSVVGRNEARNWGGGALPDTAVAANSWAGGGGGVGGGAACLVADCGG